MKKINLLILLVTFLFLAVTHVFSVGDECGGALGSCPTCQKCSQGWCVNSCPVPTNPPLPTMPKGNGTPPPAGVTITATPPPSGGDPIQYCVPDGGSCGSGECCHDCDLTDNKCKTLGININNCSKCDSNRNCVDAYCWNCQDCSGIQGPLPANCCKNECLTQGCNPPTPPPCAPTTTKLYLSNGVNDFTTGSVTERVAPLYLYTEVTDTANGFSVGPTYTNGLIDYQWNNAGSWANIASLQNQAAFELEQWNYGNNLADGSSHGIKSTFQGNQYFCNSVDTNTVNKAACTANSNTVNLAVKPDNVNCSSVTYQNTPLTITEGTSPICVQYTNNKHYISDGILENSTNGETINNPAATDANYRYATATLTQGNYTINASTVADEPYCAASDNNTLTVEAACTLNANTVYLADMPVNGSCASAVYNQTSLTISSGTDSVCVKFVNNNNPAATATLTNSTNGTVIKDPATTNVGYVYDTSGLSKGTYSVTANSLAADPYCAATNTDNSIIVVQNQLTAPVISKTAHTASSITWTWNKPNPAADYVWFQISDNSAKNADGSFVSTLPVSNGIVNAHIYYPTLTNTNTSLSCGQTYYAQVRAEDSDVNPITKWDNSPWSNTASFNIPCPQPAVISGNLFEDNNGNKQKDVSESLVLGTSAITVIPTRSGGSVPTGSCVRNAGNQTFTCTFTFTDFETTTYNFGANNLTPYSQQTGCDGPSDCSLTFKEGDTKTLNLGFIKGPFLQTSGGSVHAGGGVSMNIPSSPIAFDGGSNTARVMVLNNAGVVTSNGTQTYSTIAGAQASTPNYTDASYTNNSSQFNYAFFANKLTSKTQTFTPSGGAKLENGKITDLNNATNNITLENNKVYLVKGDLEVNNSTSISGVNSVILVNGNITISSNFKPTNSYLAFIASGTLTIDPVVSEINAILHSDGLFSDGDSSQINVLGLKITGAISTNTGFSLVRRQTTDKPGEYIIFDPAFYIKLENSLGLSSRFWSEVMP